MVLVIGIDFGNDSCVVSACLDREIHIVTTDGDLHYTPSMVAFGERKRVFGVAAKNQWTENIANTIFDFKGILDATLTKKWKFDLLKVNQNPIDLSLSFDVSLCDEKLRFYPYQVLAMLFSKIKAQAQAFLGTNERIVGCVIAVPVHFSELERKSVLLAAAIAKLDCHHLVKETTAAAMNYSLFKKFSTPVNVIFIDFGHSSIQISAWKYSESRMEVIEEVSALIGGRDIDEMLAEYFIDTFKIRSDSKYSKIFTVQLLQDVEQLKKKMSFTVERLPLDFKQMFNGEPIRMDREEMERICAPLFAKVEKLMRLCLERSKLDVKEIHSIELVGGSTRIPIVQTLAQKVFGKVPVATMNRDEAVARGCLLKYISSIKKKGYKVVDKPFSDTVTCNVTRKEMKDMVRVFQLHKHLKCECLDAFDITEDQYVGYVDTEAKLVKSDFDEDMRAIARNELDVFLTKHQQHDGLLVNCTSKVASEIHYTRMWDDGSREQYVNLLCYWKQKVEKLKRRREMQYQMENKSVNSVNIVRNNIPQTAANQIFAKKLTFKDKAEVRLIEPNRKRTTDSGLCQSQPSMLVRLRRKSLRSRHNRSNQFAKESQDTGLATCQIDDEESLLFRQRGQRKKKMNWCCFL